MFLCLKYKVLKLLSSLNLLHIHYTHFFCLDLPIGQHHFFSLLDVLLFDLASRGRLVLFGSFRMDFLLLREIMSYEVKCFIFAVLGLYFFQNNLLGGFLLLTTQQIAMFKEYRRVYLIHKEYHNYTS